MQSYGYATREHLIAQADGLQTVRLRPAAGLYQRQCPLGTAPTRAHCVLQIARLVSASRQGRSDKQTYAAARRYRGSSNHSRGCGIDTRWRGRPRRTGTPTTAGRPAVQRASRATSGQSHRSRTLECLENATAAVSAWRMWHLNVVRHIPHVSARYAHTHKGRRMATPQYRVAVVSRRYSAALSRNGKSGDVIENCAGRTRGRTSALEHSISDELHERRCAFLSALTLPPPHALDM